MVAAHQQRELAAYVETHSNRLVQIARELIRRPSENIAPNGNEFECQNYAGGLLKNAGYEVELYSLDSVRELAGHQLYWPGRNYSGRPNLVARRRGRSGRSLILSGHIDTVPAGTQPWTRDPFGAKIEGNRIYGRGANDMKGGVATNLFVAECIADLGIELDGELIVESVVDEEWGGVNGTLAARLRGIRADAAVLSEPSLLRVCPAQRGGRIAHITLRAGASGILNDGATSQGVIPALTRLLSKVPEFQARRSASAPVHDLYSDHPNPVPVYITRVYTSPWGFAEPTTIPEEARIEICWQAMPGETAGTIDGEFVEWLNAAAPQAEVTFPVRWLPSSFIPRDHAVVREFARCADATLQREPRITGIEGPCDLFVFHEFGIPALLWGARGGNTHSADEYVEIDSLVEAAQALLAFVCHWCGVKER